MPQSTVLNKASLSRWQCLALALTLTILLSHGQGSDFRHPRQLTSISGDTVRLECNRTVEGTVDWKVDYDPDGTLAYICNNGRVTDRFRPRVELDLHNYTLTIHDVMVNDSGRYYCVDEAGRHIFTRLDVVLPPPGELGLVNRTETSLAMYSNQSGIVTGYNVSVNGKPATDVSYAGIGRNIVTIVVYNLIPGSRYSVNVWSSRNEIYSKTSTMANYSTVPAAPGVLSLVNRTEKCLTIRWNQWGRVTKYTVLVDNTCAQDADYFGVGTDSVTAVLCCLSIDTTYRVSITAVSDDDTSQATSGEFSTIKGPPVYSPAVVAVVSVVVTSLVLLVGYVVYQHLAFYRGRPLLIGQLDAESVVTGVTQIDGKTFVTSRSSDTIKVFGVGPEFERLKQEDIKVEGLKDPHDIVACDKTKSLYVADIGSPSGIWRVSTRDGKVTIFTKTHRSYSLSVTSGAGRLLVTTDDHQLFLSEPDAVTLEPWPFEDGHKQTNVYHAVETSRDTLFVSCQVALNPAQIIEVNKEGHTIRTFKDVQNLTTPWYLSFYSESQMLIVDWMTHRILLLTSDRQPDQATSSNEQSQFLLPTNDSQRCRVLLDHEHNQLVNLPIRLFYAQQTHHLLVASDWSRVVQVFSCSQSVTLFNTGMSIIRHAMQTLCDTVQLRMRRSRND